ncbi:DUF1801 domain-containing protein [Roseivirga seohaensis]|uniref:DUF1801 domain-containing protein n=1 Tax=Roseivirga seohaensis TaxID=1914963 RepID=UPI003BA84EFE
MNKFQPVDFQDLDDLFAFLPEHELKIVEALRNLVYECIPQVKEKLSYNVPFFRLRKTVCFIWPGAVPWGGTFEGVQFGFTYGHLLTDENGYLAAGKRKFVRTKTFKSLKEIDFDQLRILLFEAAEIDAQIR